MTTQAIKRRIEKLEAYSPEISVDLLSDAELEAQIQEMAARLDKNGCPNCPGCTTQQLCKEIFERRKDRQTLIT